MHGKKGDEDIVTRRKETGQGALPFLWMGLLSAARVSPEQNFEAGRGGIPTSSAHSHPGPQEERAFLCNPAVSGLVLCYKHQRGDSETWV